MTRLARTIGLALLAAAAACGEGSIDEPPPPPPTLDAQVRQQFSRWGVIPIGEMPAQDPALVDLGQALMFDKILSGNRDIACATCHDPANHLGDGLPLAIGTGGTGLGPARTLGPGRQFVPRNAPSLLNVGLGLFYVFWDGRISGFRDGPFDTPAGTQLPRTLPNVLAAQAMFPVVNRREMRGDPGDQDVFGNPNELAQFGDSQFAEIWKAVMQRLLAIPAYVTKFQAAFPTTPTHQLGFQHAAAAMAAFEMQAFTKTRSPFDRYLDRDNTALTADEKNGALLFFAKARCSSCHNGPFLGGQGFANAGVPQLGPGAGRGTPLDFGRGEVLSLDFYRFAFRVATLRNVELTGPYMHDGTFATLEDVLRHYNDVPRELREHDVSLLDPALRALYHGDDATIAAVSGTLDGRLRTPLGLTPDEVRLIVAFLKSMTDPAARDLGALVPASVPSGLPVR